jgi:hypothetical protein
MSKKRPFDLGEDFSLINKKIAEAAHQGKQDLAIKIADELLCDHGVVFDEAEYKKHPNMSAAEVRKRWPRGWGPCPKGCGFNGIAYASFMHYIAGDW